MTAFLGRPFLLPEAGLSSTVPIGLQSITSLGNWPPFFWSGLRILVILGIALLVLQVADRLTNRWISRAENREKGAPRRQQILTLGNLIQSASRYVVWPIATVMILSEMNLEVGALLATAGVAGLAIGFGAQTLVKDVIGGIFLLFDNIIQVGDLVSIGGTTGTVEEIGVRLVKVRRLDGELIIIPAGEIRIFGNKSVDWTRAVVPVGLSYDQDVDAILRVMKSVAQGWVDEHEDVVLEDEPQVQGLMDFGDSSVTARVVVKVKPGQQSGAERELRQRLKRTFDERGIEIPFPQRIVHVVGEGGRLPRTPDPPAQGHVPAGEGLNAESQRG